MNLEESDLFKEQLEKAMKCESVEELMELAKTEGFDITKEEPEYNYIREPN